MKTRFYGVDNDGRRVYTDLQTKRAYKRLLKLLDKVTRDRKSRTFVFPKLDDDSLQVKYIRVGRRLDDPASYATPEEIRAGTDAGKLKLLSDPEVAKALYETSAQYRAYCEEDWSDPPGLPSEADIYARGKPWPRVRANWRRTWQFFRDTPRRLRRR